MGPGLPKAELGYGTLGCPASQAESHPSVERAVKPELQNQGCHPLVDDDVGGACQVHCHADLQVRSQVRKLAITTGNQAGVANCFTNVVVGWERVIVFQGSSSPILITCPTNSDTPSGGAGYCASCA